MIMEKLRRKQWFYNNLKNKDINEGDLVLLYSIPNQKWKISSLPSCGVDTTRIETIEGVGMDVYFNANKVKWFYGPLIEDVLFQIHKKKEQQKREQKLKHDALNMKLKLERGDWKARPSYK